MKTVKALTIIILVPVLVSFACSTSNNVESPQVAQNQPSNNQIDENQEMPLAPTDDRESSSNSSDTSENIQEEPVIEDTSTPEPTSNPNLISEGTYLVGTDIQPGLYRGNAGEGFFKSCYWERLSGLSGEFEDIIANDGPNGQFYVEVMESDEAFKVDCEVEYLETIPTPANDFPKIVPVGTYLVGIDIAPGIYRGEAGLDVMDSCYWERKSGLSGEFDDLITNDGPNGQFYVEIFETDTAFTTDCEIEYLASLPEPIAEFPITILPGTYLVGIDIAPGTYRGEAGDDILDACYWERLSGLSGEFSDLITNDGPNGQFFVQVSPSDFAFKTNCILEFTGS